MMIILSQRHKGKAQRGLWKLCALCEKLCDLCG